MILRNEKEKEKYRNVSKISMNVLQQVYDATHVGVYPAELDKLAEKLIAKNGGSPAFRGVPSSTGGPYKYVTCISVNDTVVHGIPSKKRALQSGDIVKLDFGMKLSGLFTDHCVTVALAPVNKAHEKFIRIAKSSVLEGVAAARTGNTVGDVGTAIREYARNNGYDVVMEFTGHGIGRHLHEDPNLPLHKKAGTGPRLEEGMLLCVEAQIVEKSNDIYMTDDGWTIKTADQGMAAMFEYMVIVGDEPEILTDSRGWDIVQY